MLADITHFMTYKRSQELRIYVFKSRPKVRVNLTNDLTNGMYTNNKSINNKYKHEYGETSNGT